MTFDATESGTPVSITHIGVAKGKVFYEINFWLDNPKTSPGLELLATIYQSWRPT